MRRTFWSCFSLAGSDALDATYDDALGRKYEYDSNVVNHKGVAVGDVLVVRDRHLVRGYGVVESIESRPDTKLMRRCPVCHSARNTQRKSRLPLYRCNKCANEFDLPLMKPMVITKYVAAYGANWFPFPSPTSVRALERVYVGRDRQNAIRRLDPTEAQALLRFHASLESHLHLELLAHSDEILGGHIEILVRARIGQQLFRDRMFERFGSTCAVTGSQPDEVLDAAHLYSFAARPEHRNDGGLLLRADVHRMFDRLLLTFDPATWCTHVAPQLLDRYEGLQPFEARPMAVLERARPERSLLAEHFSAAHLRWTDMGKSFKPTR